MTPVIVLLMIDHIAAPAGTQYALEKIQPVTLAAQVTAQLREAILRGNLKPGQRLIERELAKATGASQVTIREALQPLIHEGMVVKKTNTASYVTELSLETLREILAVRLILEPHALQLASQRLTKNTIAEQRNRIARMQDRASNHDLYQCSREDFDFHRRLWEIGGNEVLTKTLTGICTSYFAYTSILPSLSREDLEARIGPYQLFQKHWLSGVETRFEAHQELLDAVVRGVPDEIEDKVRNHILAGWRWLLEPRKS